MEKAGEFQTKKKKKSTSVSLTIRKPLTVRTTTNWKILKEMGLPDNLTCLLRNCIQVRQQQLELGREQQAGSKSEKERVSAVYCHPAYLTYMQSTSYKILGWVIHNLESGLPGEISTTSDIQIIPL